MSKKLILMICAMFGFIRVYRQMNEKSIRAPQKLPCECVRGKKVGFEELDEKELAPKNWVGVVWLGLVSKKKLGAILMSAIHKQLGCLCVCGILGLISHLFLFDNQLMEQLVYKYFDIVHQYTFLYTNLSYAKLHL